MRHDLLATSAGLASDWRLGSVASRAARRLAGSGRNGLIASRRGQCFGASFRRRPRIRTQSIDRAKKGSKHHVITASQGIPLATILTATNMNEFEELIPFVDHIPPIRRKLGQRRQKPDRIPRDRGYNSEPHRTKLRQRGIQPVLAKRNTEYGSGLGINRWVVERTLAWLHQFRRLRIRYERRDNIHEGFIAFAEAIICLNFVTSELC